MALPQVGAFPVSIQGVVDINVEDKRSPAAAFLLENMIPRQKTLSPRMGWRIAATLGYPDENGNRPSTLSPSDREIQAALFSVSLGGTNIMLITDQRGSYWILEYAKADPQYRPFVGPPVPGENYKTIQSPTIVGPANRRVNNLQAITTSFINAAGTYNAVTVDGSSVMKIYESPRIGSTLNVTEIPQVLNAVTDQPLDTTEFNYVNSFQNRLVFAQKNSLKMWYTQEVRSVPQLDPLTPVEDFGLDSIFDQGGDILLINKFSMNTGADRFNMIAVTTDQGQSAIYSTVTFDESDIQLHSLPTIGKPLGKYSSCNIGSDLYIATVNGFVSLRASAGEDNKAVYLSDNIQDLWLEYSEQYDTFNVIREPFREQNLILIAPEGSNDILVYNYRTNAWGVWKQPEPIRSLHVADGTLFGTSNNLIKAFNGGQDEILSDTNEVVTKPIHYVNIPRHVNFGSNTNKSFHSCKITLTTDGPYSVIPFLHDFESNDNKIPVPPPPSQPPESKLGEAELGKTNLSIKKNTRATINVPITGNAEVLSVGISGISNTEQYSNVRFERINPIVQSTNHP